MILVREEDIDILPLPQFGVIHVVNLALTGLAFILLIGGTDHVKNTAHHEGIGGRAFVIDCLPSGLKAQSIRIELAQNDTSIILFGSVDNPQSPFVNRQVDVRFPTPAIWRGVVVVGIGDYGLPALYPSPQVKLDDISRAFLVEEDGPVIGHKSSSVNAVWKFVGSRLSTAS